MRYAATSLPYGRFFAHRRSVVALWLFSILLAISLGAEFIANDKPLMVYHKGSVYFPVFRFYSEKTFGGTFDTEANYKDPYVKEILKKSGWCLWPPIPYGPSTVNYELHGPAPSPPSLENWLGTDDQGRDLLARLIYGYRFSILFGITLTFVSVSVGFIVGALQGYFGGYVDLITQRLMEIWSGFPIIFLLIILYSMITPNFWWLLFFMSLFKWMIIVPLVRSEFLRARTFDYVRAARAMGVGPFTIMFRHIFPNVISGPLTMIPFILIACISVLATLDFLGFGLPLGSASLGEILNQGRNNLSAPWIGLTGFLSLSLLLVSLVFIGEGVRDAFRKKGSGPLNV